jgi:hypothetical protein
VGTHTEIRRAALQVPASGVDDLHVMNVPMSYVEPPTVPEGMTLREWRRQQRAGTEEPARRSWLRLRRRPRRPRPAR